MSVVRERSHAITSINDGNVSKTQSKRAQNENGIIIARLLYAGQMLTIIWPLLKTCNLITMCLAIAWVPHMRSVIVDSNHMHMQEGGILISTYAKLAITRLKNAQ